MKPSEGLAHHGKVKTSPGEPFTPSTIAAREPEYAFVEGTYVHRASGRRFSPIEFCRLLFPNVIESV